MQFKLFFSSHTRQLFDTIRKERPNDLNKVIPICGDITAPELGISETDQVRIDGNCQLRTERERES